jgi:hypothetical protein
MACNCRSTPTAVVLPEDGSTPDEFPPTDPNGAWLVNAPHGGATYAFSSLANARKAADMVGGTISSR